MEFQTGYEQVFEKGGAKAFIKAISAHMDARNPNQDPNTSKYGEFLEILSKQRKLFRYILIPQDIQNMGLGIYSLQIRSWISDQVQEIQKLLKLYSERDRGNSYTLTYSKNILLKIWASFLLKKQVMPKTYIDDIKRILSLDHIKQSISGVDRRNAIGILPGN